MLTVSSRECALDPFQLVLQITLCLSTGFPPDSAETITNSSKWFSIEKNSGVKSKQIHIHKFLHVVLKNETSSL